MPFDTQVMTIADTLDDWRQTGVNGAKLSCFISQTGSGGKPDGLLNIVQHISPRLRIRHDALSSMEW